MIYLVLRVFFYSEENYSIAPPALEMTSVWACAWFHIVATAAEAFAKPNDQRRSIFQRCRCLPSLKNEGRF